MRTTVDIPDDLLKKVMYWSKAKTKKEAIHTALSEYVRREAMEALLALPGTMPDLEDIHEEMTRLEFETHGPPGTRKFLEDSGHADEGPPAQAQVA
ncbi:MAG: type II toxin-antitoxin system VapB family antitoxin [Chloroflexi bacterium]|nr:type II toxin-antitoxin system VapB family antitoxin [Chloroflexota bacterium]